MSDLIDRDDREAAIRERDRNVLVTASAGTGKTKLIVDRLVELLAPRDGRAPITIDRIAAITFTRKAAGELRVRTRQQILERLAIGPDSIQSLPLRQALDGIDTAHITTIHGFADRLLRRWPAQARIDPRYELEDDLEGLEDACFRTLTQAVEAGTLADLLTDCVVDRVDEAMTTLVDLRRAGLRLRSRETEFWAYHGLDNLIAGFVRQRDVEVPDPAPPNFDRTTFETFVAEYLRLVEGLSSATHGGRWLLQIGDLLRTVADEPDATLIYRELVDRLERGPHQRASDPPSKKLDFPDDPRAWEVWKAFDGDTRKKSVRARPLRDDLLDPLRRWFATRLVRLRPVVLHVYEGVKARRQVVDHLDLLVRLRDLLRDDRGIRRACQALFDHIFVDEFQDTDPLQAEIVLYLCEHGAVAASWETVQLTPGMLTLVGDPKQSIYRFRRADIATYQHVVAIVERSPHRSVQLSSSFRSTPGLVDWLNERFETILGTAPDGAPFRRETGEVCHQPLAIGRTSGSNPAVHVVAFDDPTGTTAEAYRLLEARVVSRYVRWLVGMSGIRIVDPITHDPRAIGYGDVGVLAITTSSLPVLFDAFDRDDVPHASRGGTLFIADPLHRRFLLGLCALADRDDGVALAALLRRPFFSIDLGDLARSNPDDPDDRASQARAIVTELRRRRFERGPGATARALLEQTGLGRAIAHGPNGRQRLTGIRELCFLVEVRSNSEQLDFDATIERMRGWIEMPPQLDRPHPVTDDVVQVLTVHQAKGLEFPVVVLWDCRADWKARATHDAWTVHRDGLGWALQLDQLHWEEPPEREIAARERRQREAERKRLVYVAATRARDVLIVPKAGPIDDKLIMGTLIGAGSSRTVMESPLHTPPTPAAWFTEAAPTNRVPSNETTTRDVELSRAWSAHAANASQPHARPSTFSSARSQTLWDKPVRFGSKFGEVVHLAIGLALGGAPTRTAVASAAARTGVTDHLAAAEADVDRVLTALARLGISSSTCQLEYPVAGLSPTGELTAGYIDLVADVAGSIMVLDFKTDVPPEGDDLPPSYVEQVDGYARTLRRALAIGPIRAGLLFTADGVVRWLPPGDNVRS